jgi:hypothetical protein
MGRKTLLGYAGRLLRWSLVAVVLFIALIGYLYIVRGTAVRHVRGVGADATPVAPAEPQFPLSVAMLTGTPRRSSVMNRQAFLEPTRRELSRKRDELQRSQPSPFRT